MAKRPVYLSNLSGDSLVHTEFVEFIWFAGMSVAQKQRSIASLHEAADKSIGGASILEVSSKSPSPLGVRLSAFNLMLSHGSRRFSVESAFQSSKVFEGGGPFPDLLERNSRDAKKDPRLQESGRLVGFSYFGDDWGLEPQTAFYDWLYLNALYGHPGYAKSAQEYTSFTDIEFNPEKSINCQAYSAALFVSLAHRGELVQAITSRPAFLELLAGRPVSNAQRNDRVQRSFGF
jgi:hypothetical protein